MRGLLVMIGGYSRTASFLIASTEPLCVSAHKSSTIADGHAHNSVQIPHLAIPPRIERVLSRGVEPVDLGLQRAIRFRVREQTADDARERARDGVCACDDREDAVVDELLERWRGLVWLVFVILRRAVGGGRAKVSTRGMESVESRNVR